MALRLLLLALVVYLVYRVLRSVLRRKLYAAFGRQEERRQKRDLGVDPRTIRDAEYTDITDKDKEQPRS